MERIVAMLVSIAVGLLLLVVIISVLSIKMGPPGGLLANFIDSIGKIFGV